MQLQDHIWQNLVAEEQDHYHFTQEDGVWYIHLPPDRGCEKKDLRMAEGAHKFLNFLSNGSKKLRLRISTQPRDGVATLELVEHCEAPRGGAIYLFVPASGEAQGTLFWILDLALFVFGDMPERIYVQRLSSGAKAGLSPENGKPATQYDSSPFHPTHVTHNQYPKD